MGGSGTGASVMLLGAAQDGGVPHMACNCTNCAGAKSDSTKRQSAVSLALVDEESQKQWLIDCSPDIKEQYDLLMSTHPQCTVEGILLTHLHMGHYIGLFQFGKEAINRLGLKVYGSRRVCDFFRENEPWKHYLSGGNIDLVELQPSQTVNLTDSISITPLPVPHRQEYSDTVAYYVQGPSKRIFYCPDIDTWQTLRPDIREIVGSVDVAFLDGCFYSAAEVKSRDIHDIPHPLVTDTVERLKGLETRVVLVHLNHTNPLWQKGQERQCIEDLGFSIGDQGRQWII